MQISGVIWAWFEPVEHWLRVKVVGLDVAEVPFHVFEVLQAVTTAAASNWSAGCPDVQYVVLVRAPSAWICPLTGDGQAGIGDGDGEVLAGFVRADHLADLDADRPGTLEPASRHAGEDGGEQLAGGRPGVVLPGRVLVGSGQASAGMRQAISRSPGKSGEVISARSCSSNRDICSGPPSAISLRMAGARSAVIHP